MMWVNFTRPVLSEKQIKIIEDHYGAVYIGCFSKPTSDLWESMFYQKNPKTELGHSHVLSVTHISESMAEMTCRDPGFFLRDGSWVEKETFGSINVNGMLVVSCGVHNYRETPLGFIDGGSAYFRSSGAALVIEVRPDIKVLGEYVLNNPGLPYDGNRFSVLDYSPYLGRKD